MWYKNFMPHVASIAAPLFAKTAKRKIEWDEEAILAVKCLKEALERSTCRITYVSAFRQVTADSCDDGCIFGWRRGSPGITTWR